MPEKIVSRKEITIGEAKDTLEKIENPNPFQVRTLEYANKFSKGNLPRMEELIDRLVKEFEIDRRDAIEVVNSMPTSIEELRVFFSTGKKRLVIATQLEKILSLLDEYR